MRGDASAKLDHLQFRKKLANELIGAYSGRKKRGPKPKRNTIPIEHRFERVKEPGPCRHCYNETRKGKEHQRTGKRSRYRCMDCDVYLCVVPCWNDYVGHRLAVATNNDESKES